MQSVKVEYTKLKCDLESKAFHVVFVSDNDSSAIMICYTMRYSESIYTVLLLLEYFYVFNHYFQEDGRIWRKRIRWVYVFNTRIEYGIFGEGSQI